MKKINHLALISIMLLGACNWSREEAKDYFSQMINTQVTCAWHREYRLCFCGRAGQESAMLTVVPDRDEQTCGKRYVP
jgi:hypothetical protein